MKSIGAKFWITIVVKGNFERVFDALKIPNFDDPRDFRMIETISDFIWGLLNMAESKIIALTLIGSLDEDADIVGTEILICGKGIFKNFSIPDWSIPIVTLEGVSKGLSRAVDIRNRGFMTLTAACAKTISLAIRVE